MGVLEDYPFAFRTVNTLLVLKGFGCAAKVDSITAILLSLQDVRYHSWTPVKRNGRRLTALSAYANPVFRFTGVQL